MASPRTSSTKQPQVSVLLPLPLAGAWLLALARGWTLDPIWTLAPGPWPLAGPWPWPWPLAGPWTLAGLGPRLDPGPWPAPGSWPLAPGTGPCPN